MTASASDAVRPWWQGDELSCGRSGLELEGVPVADLALLHGTPLYVYSASVIRRRLSELRAALRSTEVAFRIHYAMKANRFPPLLDLVRAEGDIGIDACSPREVQAAQAAGFAPHEISVTAGMLSNRDLEAFDSAGVHLNLDTRSGLRRWAARRPRVRQVGLRIDPGVQVGWGDDPRLAYGRGKFGFDFADAVDAARFAAAEGLEVDELHIHPGWCLQESAAPVLAEVYARLGELAAAIPSVRTINVGGGLGWRQRAEDAPLSPRTWAELLHKHLARTGCSLACEPGTFVAASAGLLLAEVNTVEARFDGEWIGLDAGHNVNCYAAHYGIPLAVIPVARPLSSPVVRVNVAGNINEANDVFGRGVPLPRLHEGELVVLYPAGAYGASMASDHCLRGLPREVLL